MKKDKEWLKEKMIYLKEAVGKPVVNDFSRGLNGAYDTLELLIDQLDEPEKVVIPQFVAEYLDGKEKWTAFELFYDIDELNIASGPISKWTYDNDNEENHKREIVLLSALRNGYTIEREKRYRLKSINKHLKNYSMAFNPLENSFHCTSDQYLILSKSQTVFTESELKIMDLTGFDKVEVTE